MYKLIELQDTEVFIVLTALEEYAKNSKTDICEVVNGVIKKIDAHQWHKPTPTKPKLEVGMLIFFCEPDLTSGQFRIHHFECSDDGETMYACSDEGNRGFCVNIEFCEPARKYVHD